MTVTSHSSARDLHERVGPATGADHMQGHRYDERIDEQQCGVVAHVVQHGVPRALRRTGAGQQLGPRDSMHLMADGAPRTARGVAVEHRIGRTKRFRIVAERFTITGTLYHRRTVTLQVVDAR